MHGDYTTIGKLSIMQESHIRDIDLNAKMASVQKLFGLALRKAHILCTHHTIYYMYYGRSVHSLYIRPPHKYAVSVVNIG